MPRIGIPASGPGLRALNLASGLAAHGHEIIVATPAIPNRPSKRLETSNQPLHADAVEVPIAFEGLPNFVRIHKPDAVIMTNYINFHYLLAELEKKNLGNTKLIYDFFAPRILEQRAGNIIAKERLAAEIEKKRNAFRSADAFLLNGSKKLGYVTAWLASSGANLNKPIVEAPFCVPASFPGFPSKPAAKRARQHAIISGSRHAWTSTKLEIVDLLPRLAKLGWQLTHVGNPRFELAETSSKSYLPYLNSDNFTSMSDLDFVSFIDTIRDADVAIDVFNMTREREFAYLIRTAVALSAGVPVIHPNNTELSPIIKAHNLGFLYSSPAEVFSILDWLTVNPAQLAEAAASTAAYCRDHFNPKSNTADASRLITELVATTKSRSSRAYLSEVSARKDWYAYLTSPEWLARRLQLDYFSYANFEAPEELYVSVMRKYNYPVPNFCLAHAFRHLPSLDMRNISLSDVENVLSHYIDVDWYSTTYGVKPTMWDCARDYFSKCERGVVSPSPYFSERVYLGCNPGVADAIQNRVFVNGFHHFLTHPEAAKCAFSLMYDERVYLSLNSDVDAAVKNGVFASGFEHFMIHGAKEGRQSSPLFDPAFYLSQYRDLPRTGTRSELINHFLRYGLKEKRHGSLFHRQLVTIKLDRALFSSPSSALVARWSNSTPRPLAEQILRCASRGISSGSAIRSSPICLSDLTGSRA